MTTLILHTGDTWVTDFAEDLFRLGVSLCDQCTFSKPIIHIIF